MTTQLTKTDLEIKIAQMTAEFNFKNEVISTLPNIKTLAFLTGHDKEQKRLICTCKSIEEAKLVLSLFPATNNEQIIGTESDKYYCKLNTSFRVTIKNPCRPCEYNDFNIQFSYESNGIDMEIVLPITLVKDFVSTGERNITDSEHHYFIGVPYNKLHSMRVRQYNFIGMKQINWYGGDKTLTDEKIINNIIDIIKTKTNENL